MWKILRFICMGWLTTAFSSAAFAQSPADVNVIGFSRGGTYFAFEEYGTGDDENDKSPYSTMYIVNVAKNSLAVAPFKANGSWHRKGDILEIRIYGRLVKKRLKRFGIVEGYLDQMTSTDLTADNFDTDNPTPKPRNGATLPKTMKFITDIFLERDPTFPDDFYPNYAVKINPVLLPRENCREFKREMFSFEMILSRNERRVLILQKPKKICADVYGIENICLYRNKLAVIAASLSVNSTGPDNRFVVVTGVIPDK